MRQPAAPDPCSVLTPSQVDAALPASARSGYDLSHLTTQGNYQANRDEAGAPVECSWSAIDNQTKMSVPLLTLTISPVSMWADEPCVKQVAGLGQAACTTNGLGGLAVKGGPFYEFDIVADVTTASNSSADLAMEKQLAADVIPALPTSS